jgi:hypothetical protein
MTGAREIICVAMLGAAVMYSVAYGELGYADEDSIEATGRLVPVAMGYELIPEVERAVVPRVLG